MDGSCRDILVIFDLDGTLFETGSSVIPAVNDSLRDIGMETMDSEDILFLLGERTPVFCEKVVGGRGDKYEEFREKLWYYEHKYIGEKGRLFDGTEDMLGDLKGKGFELAVCSNGSQEYIDYVLETTGIGGHFGEKVSASKMESKEEAIERLIDKSENKTAVMVGDKDHDFSAAEDVGIPSIGVSYGYGYEEEMDNADFVADSPSEIVEHVLKVEIFGRVEDEIGDTPWVIGINGVDNSGKTVFSRDLERYLQSRGHDTQLIELDDFHNEKQKRRDGEDEIQAYWDDAFDRDRLEREVLKPIRDDGELDAELELLNLESDEYSVKKRYKVDRDTVVILEGTLLFREPIDKYIDHRIFLDIDLSKVLERAKLRDEERFDEDTLERYKRKYIPIQKKYLRECEPLEKADLVIDNKDFKEPKLID